jgi:hypothetical protein
MLESTEAEVAMIGVRHSDDAYLAWFYAEDEAETILRGWFQATGERRKVAYLAYRAALEREEAAARDLERLWLLASTCSDVVVQGTEVQPVLDQRGRKKGHRPTPGRHAAARLYDAFPGQVPPVPTPGRRRLGQRQPAGHYGIPVLVFRRLRRPQHRGLDLHRGQDLAPVRLDSQVRQRRRHGLRQRERGAVGLRHFPMTASSRTRITRVSSRRRSCWG